MTERNQGLEAANEPTEHDETAADEKRLVIVGIGASAGGLEALKALLPNLPERDDIAYVVAQHLDPKHRTMLVNLLTPTTTMEVLEVAGGGPVRAGKIYIAPPGKDVSIVDGHLRLTPPSSAIGPKPSINRLFDSLAKDRGHDAVGIILSGTGSDGSIGIRAIKAEGGITIAQREDTAKFNGMPRAAIETGHIDLVLDPDAIGQELPELLAHPRTLPLEEPTDNIEQVLKLVAQRTGDDFSEYKANTLERRIKRRMAVHKLDQVADYIRTLQQSPRETELLARDILVSVTAFFRDREAFRSLERGIRELLEHKHPGDSIRVWVPGCATGEEAYSIAILFDRILGAQRNEYRLQIFGTDLDEDAIGAARRAIYPDSALEEVDPDIVERYFQPGENAFRVVKPVREMVVFARHNLIKDPPFSRLDLISCRNLLIYFKTPLQKRLVPMFHYVLGSGGCLFLGKSESVGTFTDLFEPLDKRWKLFRRKNTAVTQRGNFHDYFPNTAFQPDLLAPVNGKPPSLGEVMNQAIAESFGPTGVLVDEQMRVRHVRGDVSPYLLLAPGDVDLNLFNMAQGTLRLDLRTLCHKALRDATPLHKEVRLQDNEADSLRLVDLSVHPVSIGKNGATMLLVLFEEKPAQPLAALPARDAEGADPRMHELERELTATREHLQTTVEELETANEELQSLNEELQSANEELQSSNEELETSNEELQSTNEELTTVNEELQVKSGELSMLNVDLENILGAIATPLLVVDGDLRITRFTPAVRAIFNLSELDVGQVLTTVPCRLSIPHLREQTLEAMARGETMERLLNGEHTIYQLHIQPYFSEHNDTHGAILTFHEHSRRQDLERHLLDIEALYHGIVDNRLNAILTFTEEGKIDSCNPAAEQLFGYPADQLLGAAIEPLLPSLSERRDTLGGPPHDLEIVRKDGCRVPVKAVVNPARLEGERRVYIALLCPEKRPPRCHEGP